MVLSKRIAFVIMFAWSFFCLTGVYFIKEAYQSANLALENKIALSGPTELSDNFYAGGIDKIRLMTLAKKIDPERSLEVYASLDKYSGNTDLINKIEALASNNQESPEILAAKIRVEIEKQGNNVEFITTLLILFVFYAVIMFVIVMRMSID